MHAAAAFGHHTRLPAVNDSPAADDPLVRLARLALIGELAPGLAHEINNPLFAVLGLVEFLLLEAEPGTKAHERLELVQSTGMEIKDIVRGLVDFARVRGDVENAALDEAAARAADLARRTSLAKSVELVVHYPSESVPTAARRSDLEQALLGLVVRSMQAAGEPGTVTLEVSASDGQAVAVVRHSGRAIAADALAGEETIDPAKLPLAAAARLAAGYGGTLTASFDADGQTFRFSIPEA
jgi:C4-dicarboxylate-specific signal transduction histidine kinase